MGWPCSHMGKYRFASTLRRGLGANVSLTQHIVHSPLIIVLVSNSFVIGVQKNGGLEWRLRRMDNIYKGEQNTKFILITRWMTRRSETHRPSSDKVNWTAKGTVSWVKSKGPDALRSLLQSLDARYDTGIEPTVAVYTPIQRSLFEVIPFYRDEIHWTSSWYIPFPCHVTVAYYAKSNTWEGLAICLQMIFQIWSRSSLF